MGWTGITTNDSIEEVFQSAFNASGYQVKKVAFVHDEYYAKVGYAAIKHPKGFVFGLVVLFHVLNENGPREVQYKEIDESMGPADRKCPESILQVLSPLEEIGHTGYAKEWREDCLKNAQKREKKKLRGFFLDPNGPTGHGDMCMSDADPGL